MEIAGRFVGYEYIIAYQPQDRQAWDAFVGRLENPKTADGWVAFGVELTDAGVYFVDHGRSAAAAIAFRRIVDEAIVNGDSVSIREV